MNSDDEYIAELNDDIRLRVRLGVTLLDGEHPDWYLKIKIGLLDMGHWQYCILGQLYGDYIFGLRSLDIPAGFDYGFAGLGQEIKDLNELWINEIRERLSKNAA